MKKKAYVTITHTVVVENIENMSEEDIILQAVDMFNELPPDELYKTSEDILKIEIKEDEE